jgi:hypothetical protein
MKKDKELFKNLLGNIDMIEKVSGEFVLKCDTCKDTWFPKEADLMKIPANEKGISVVSLGNCRCGNLVTLEFRLTAGINRRTPLT